MIKNKISILLKSLILALSVNTTYAYTTDRDSHLNSNLTNYLDSKQQVATFYGWHSSAMASRDRWIFYYTNEDYSSGVGSHTIYNGNISSYFSGSRVFDNKMVVYYSLPEQVKKFVDVYGFENLGMKIQVGSINSTQNNQISYSLVDNYLKLEFNPVLQTTNNTLWQSSDVWSSMNAYGKIAIPTVRSGYGYNYVSASFGGITGSSIVVNNDVLSSAYKNTSGGMSFRSSNLVLTGMGTMVPLNTVSVAATVWGGGSHGVYFNYPIKVQFYDTTIHSRDITVSDTEYFDGSTYWVKSGDNFKATINAYAANQSNVVKVNSQHLRITENGNSTYIDARLHSNQTSIGKWSNFSNIDFKQNLSYATRDNTTLATTYVMSLNGDRDISLKGLSRLVQHSSDFSTEKVYREVYSNNDIYIKSDSTLPSISFPSKPTWIKGADTVTVTASDTRSGLASLNVRYRVNNGAWSQYTTNNTITLSGDGVYEIEAVAKDKVGNTTTKTQTYKVDKTAPSISLSLSPSGWTNGNVTINASISDTTSGIYVKKWASGTQSASYFENSGTTLSSNSVTVSANGIYTFYAKDNAGHASIKTISVSNIDRVLPSLNGTLDYPWIKGSRTISFSSSDSNSGISVLRLWDSNKSSILKNGVISQNSATLSYVVSQEGITKYKIETVDAASNSVIKDVTVRVDNTAPKATISVPSTTDDRTIQISLSNILDSHSGMKEVLISESSSFSGTGLVKQSLTDIGTTTGSKKIAFTLSAKTTMESHFSIRTVYIRLLDNVGNYKDYSYKVKLIPKKPTIPNIITPSEDQLYIKSEKVILKWSYNSQDKDLGYLPQEKAEVTLKHVDSGKVYDLVIVGENFEQTLSNLEDGDYEVKVRVYNYENVYSESSIRKFRINKFKTDGNVMTIDIIPGSSIRYVSVLTKSSIPQGTSITGKIYYNFDSSGKVNKSEYISFETKNTNRLENIIKLPKKVQKIRVEYFLKGNISNKFISPELDQIIVYAR